MRDGWDEVALGDLFETTNQRLGLRAEEPEVFSVTKYDGVVRASEYFDKRIASAKLDGYKVLEPNDWAYSTIHIDEGSIARNRLGVAGVVSPMYTTMRLKSAKALPYFCELVLRSPRMLALYGDVQQGSINRRRSLPWKVFSALTIPLPPLHEQWRIVDLIGALDNTIAAAEESLARTAQTQERLREVIPGGDSLPIGSVLFGIDSGTSTKPVVGDGAPVQVLSLAAVRPGRFRPAAVKDVGPAQLPAKALLREGDLLITRSNTPERVGYVAVARGVPDRTYIPDLIWRLVVDESMVSRDYLAQLLSSPTMRARITASATGTSQSMQKINKTNFSALRIPVPDASAQCAYVAPILAFDDVAMEQESTVSNLHALRSNLLTALLSGEHEIPESYDELLEEAS
ncbi:Restriction endonuclease S subunit [Raineyella antarctica]|uniref:Restriction endonuclease S subunit n=1 Tax=Raineyella antarctica TaxID=1577474 RepID=A0A1G6IP52_9ACTN|nr:restriction endonuclease subunit S [Raineyella antarctica]SDC08269.1 Restriction endonuclease S subunit [Raineyella antarctica]